MKNSTAVSPSLHDHGTLDLETLAFDSITSHPTDADVFRIKEQKWPGAL